MANRNPDKLVRYVYLHLGDGDEDAGRREIECALKAALDHLTRVDELDSTFVNDTLCTQDPATLARLFFQLHFYFARRAEC